MQVRIYNSFESAEPLRERWDEFVERLDGEIFLTFDWLRVWWKHYHRGRSLMIHVFEVNGVMVGLLPLCREITGRGPFRVRFLRLVGLDYTPVTVSLMVETEHTRAVAVALLRGLDELEGWDMLLLGPLAGKCRRYLHFYQALASAGTDACPVRMEPAGEQTYFPVKADWPTQLALLSKQERKRFRRDYRKLEDAGLPLASELAAGAAAVSSAFAAFRQAHQTRWREVRQGGHFGDWPGATAFHGEAAATQERLGRLRLLTVSAGDHLIGYKYAYRHGQGYYAYLDARSADAARLGIDVYRLTFSELARHAMREGVRWIDSMRGRYEHKLHLGGELYSCRRIIAVRNGARWRATALRWRATLRDLIYAKLWRFRLMPRLGLAPGPLPEKWIRETGLSYLS
jgi:CelD/BcsL family acetyltransferase involved in cellulose biosynthesis